MKSEQLRLHQHYWGQNHRQDTCWQRKIEHLNLLEEKSRFGTTLWRPGAGCWCCGSCLGSRWGTLASRASRPLTNRAGSKWPYLLTESTSSAFLPTPVTTVGLICMLRWPSSHDTVLVLFSTLTATSSLVTLKWPWPWGATTCWLYLCVGRCKDPARYPLPTCRVWMAATPQYSPPHPLLSRTLIRSCWTRLGDCYAVTRGPASLFLHRVCTGWPLKSCRFTSLHRWVWRTNRAHSPVTCSRSPAKKSCPSRALVLFVWELVALSKRRICTQAQSAETRCCLSFTLKATGDRTPALPSTSPSQES